MIARSVARVARVAVSALPVREPVNDVAVITPVAITPVALRVTPEPTTV